MARYFVFIQADGVQTQANFDVIDGKAENITFQRRRRREAPEDVPATPELLAAAKVQAHALIVESSGMPDRGVGLGAFGAMRDV